MKLISVELHGYKRFEQRSSMNVDGKMVAVVGPNESGKSSFLNALRHLNNSSPFIANGGSRELTRNASIPADRTVVQAKYLLEDADREAIGHIHRAEEARWCTVGKRVEGSFWCRIEPPPQRNLRPRQKMVQALTETSSKKGFLDLATEHKEEDLVGRVEDLASALGTDVGTLPDATRERIQSLVTTLESAESDDTPKYLIRLVEQLRNLADHEEGDPYQDATNLLFNRRSRFLLFSNAERSLQSEYSLNEVWEDPPAALRNLARVAELDLQVLYAAVAANDPAQVASILERANERLGGVFSETWSQSNVAVRFSVDGQVLHVLMREPQAHYTSIAERSDGLRQFVALLAFATLERSERVPILLIDEAETHLHYDAQADLVQMLTKQDVVSKVIYTTHSIGCLPEDLGTGVRLIETEGADSYVSTIQNWFWQSGRPGFSPLLFGMGASTLAFIPVRHAVITEGIADIILWPTLLKEATGLSHLDFQVVPGLSEANRAEIVQLDGEAPRTVYLIDSDKGGQELRRQLTKAGISESRIFLIPDRGKQGLVIEDLVDPKAYLEAVNEELRRSRGQDASFPKSKLPIAGRPKAVSDWCKMQGIEPPSKRAVAYRVLESGIGGSVLAEHHTRPLQELYFAMKSLLHDPAS